ncbi:hypothetical protein BH10PSE19_BH10PSE19_05610 [soil metagenome]
MKHLLIYIMMLLAFSSLIPLTTLFLQFCITGLHRFHSHYSKCRVYMPQVAILVPAWNEGDVIGDTIDTLLEMNYPHDALRIYIIDDGSTDNTAKITHAKSALYPNNVFYLYREQGGQGKAHTLNFGLKTILADDWAEAILIMDADVLFEKHTLIKMTRHLADPKVGAVTAYVKEGNIHGNLISAFVAYEYIASQAASRRAQNVLGVQACLAGGAQLHKRFNIKDIGGQIDTSTMAEDTFTTFKTQLVHNKVIFEGNAFVYAEEPDSLQALWKQRLRWARGNVHLTVAFRNIWFHRDMSGLGGIFFDLIWFSVLLMPIFMIMSSIGLVTLFFVDQEISWAIFSFFSNLSLFVYLFITLFACLIDPKTAKRAWFAGIMFPGIISLSVLAIAFAPNFFNHTLMSLAGNNTNYWRNFFVLFIDGWVALCMFFAWGIYRLDRAGVSQKITNILLLIVGYGPVLCAISLASFIAEISNTALKWDKTEKSGKVNSKDLAVEANFNFDEELAQDIRHEKRLFWYELLVLVVIILIFALRHYFRL